MKTDFTKKQKPTASVHIGDPWNQERNCLQVNNTAPAPRKISELALFTVYNGQDCKEINLR